MASNGALYGIIGALAIVVAGGGVYIAKQNGAFGASTPAAIQPPPAPAPIAAAPPQPVPQPPAPPGNASQAEAHIAHQLVGDARRAIARGDFNSAGGSLDQAERLDPRSAEVIDARHDLREAQQQAQRQDRRVDGLVGQAREAIQHHDYGAADRLLDQAEKIDARDRDVLQVRAELNTAQQPAPKPGPEPGRR